VTIIELESLLQIFAKQRDPNQTPTEWRAGVEAHLEPTTVVLQNYSGDKLQVVPQDSGYHESFRILYEGSNLGSERGTSQTSYWY